MVKVKTMNDGTRVPIIYKDDVNCIEQEIKNVFSDMVTVVSGKGNLYNVKLSDKVKMTMDFNIGDVAVIKTFKAGWLVVDIIHQEKVDDEYSFLLKKKYAGNASDVDLERLSFLEENDEELQQQLKDFDDMFGGY